MTDRASRVLADLAWLVVVVGIAGLLLALAVLAAETGLRRETVTRALGRLRRSQA